VALVSVAAIIVTRGDQDLEPVVASLPEEWDVVIWDNSREDVDLSVYGRYAAIDRTDAELIYVQDDDCIVSDPEAIVKEWERVTHFNLDRHAGMPYDRHVVCNMPPEFRHGFYEEHALVGFGAVFHRDAPERAFDRFQLDNYGVTFPLTSPTEVSWFHRTCDIVFTALTPRVLVDVPVESLPYAHHETRLWKQPGHQADRVRMLDLVRQLL
jgi:hypothetical protein